MAATSHKPGKTKGKGRDGARTAAPSTKSAGSPGRGAARAEPSLLRQRTDPRTERRFAPKASGSALIGYLATSLGAVMVGAGVFGQFIRAAGPHPYAPYLLGIGAVVFVAGFFIGSRGVPVFRVGEAGVAIERDAQTIERLAWHEVDAVRFAQNTLTFSGAGKIVVIPVAAQPDAAALALAEARSRIPAHTSDVEETLEGPAAATGEVVRLEAPQLAGLRCTASQRLISFEKDGRLCGRCGQVYHKDEVPPRCTTCDARLG